jgi:hypothetical protein
MPSQTQDRLYSVNPSYCLPEEFAVDVYAFPCFFEQLFQNLQDSQRLGFEELNTQDLDLLQVEAGVEHGIMRFLLDYDDQVDHECDWIS